MTPYEIKLLLDIYSVSNWHEGREEPILPETIGKFEDAGLITVSGAYRNAKLTTKGRSHVSQLINLPYPQELKQWVDFAGNHIPIIN